jgi:hypothetical protein
MKKVRPLRRTKYCQGDRIIYIPLRNWGTQPGTLIDVLSADIDKTILRYPSGTTAAYTTAAISAHPDFFLYSSGRTVNVDKLRDLANEFLMHNLGLTDLSHPAITGWWDSSLPDVGGQTPNSLWAQRDYGLVLQAARKKVGLPNEELPVDP